MDEEQEIEINWIEIDRNWQKSTEIDKQKSTDFDRFQQILTDFDSFWQFLTDFVDRNRQKYNEFLRNRMQSIVEVAVVQVALLK